MAIPKEILAIERPKSTRVKYSNGRYLVIKRTSKRVGSRTVPVELGTIGEIKDGKYVEIRKEPRKTKDGRKPSTKSIDSKIEQQKAVIEKAKERYEAEKKTLAELIKLRNELHKDEIMDAVIKSDRSYAEIMAFIKGEDGEE